MYRISSFLLMLAALGFGFAACEQNPNTTTASGNFMDQPMKPPPATTTANPAIVYITTGGNIAVMDSTGDNQTTVYTTSNVALEPNWSPSNSITWTERNGTTSSIRAADISVSNGTPMSSSVRTITSVTAASPDYAQIRHARWSSLSTTNKIAFVLHSSGTANHYICLVSPSGGTWDTIYSTPNSAQILGLCWNWDDRKLAVLIRRLDGSGNFLNNYITIITTGIDGNLPGEQLGSNSSVDTELLSNSPIDWSRATSSGSDINTLVFVSGGKIYYIHSPGSGGGATTNNVSWAMAGTVTWSPTNSHLMFVKSAGTARNKSTGQWEETFDLCKNTAQTTTVKTIDSDFPHFDAQLNWHR